MQHDLVDRWKRVETVFLPESGAPEWFSTRIWQLYGFDVVGIDYQQPTDPDVPWVDGV